MSDIRETDFFTLVADKFTGTADSTAPQMVLVDSTRLRKKSRLTAVHFAASMRASGINPGYVAAYLIRGHEDRILTLSQSLNIIASHVCAEQSGSDPTLESDVWIAPIPLPIVIESNEPISLYVSCASDPINNVVTATAALEFVECG